MNNMNTERGSITAAILVVLVVVVAAGTGAAWYFQDQRQNVLEEHVVQVEDQLEELEAAPALPVELSVLKDVEFENDVFVTVELADGSVTSAKILDGAVTADKLSEDAKLLLREGSSYELTLGEAAVTAVHVATGAVTTGKILDAAVTTAKLADGSIVNVKILDGVVTSSKLKDGSITAADMATGSVVALDLADGAVTTEKLAEGAVTSDAIAEDAVTSEKVASAAVGTIAISDLSVTAAKIATGTLTGDQFSGDIAKSISGSSVFEVTDNEDGTYSIVLQTSCTDAQVLAWNATTSTWTCSTQSGGVTLATVSGLDNSSGLAVDVDGSDLLVTADGISVADSYLRNDASDSIAGTLSASSIGLTPTSSSPSTAEGTLYYDSDDDTVYLRTATGFTSVSEVFSSKTESDALLAAKANASDVYTQTETYTQSEIDALISASGAPTGALRRVAELVDQDLRTSADLNGDGNLLIYTVPTGKKFFFYALWIDYKSGSSDAGISSLGRNATSYSDFSSFLTVPFDTAKAAMNVVSQYSDVPIAVAGDEIYLTTYTEASGANAYDFHLYGWLEDE